MKLRAGDYDRDPESGLLVPRRRGVMHARPQWMSGPRLFAGVRSSGPATDPYWPNVTALLHFNGTNGSTVITDSSGQSTWAVAGSAAITTSVSAFGSASANFNPGAIGTYIASAASYGQIFGTADFTIEFWHYGNITLLPGQARIMYDQRPLGNGAYITLYYLGSSSALIFLTGGAARITTASGVLKANTWQHIALSRVSGTTRLFVDGIPVGTYADTNSYLGGTVTRLGQTSASNAAANQLAGYLDDLRVTNGTGRYTASFSPPTAAFPNSGTPSLTPHRYWRCFSTLIGLMTQQYFAMGWAGWFANVGDTDSLALSNGLTATGANVVQGAATAYSASQPGVTLTASAYADSGVAALNGPWWIGVDFGTPVRPAEFGFYPRAHSPENTNCAPVNFQIQWSDDNVNWTTIGATTSFVSGTIGTEYRFAF